MSRFRCRSFRTTTWSSRSRRQLPTQRSATPFCHGLRKLVRFGCMPEALHSVDHFLIEIKPAIKDQIAGRGIVGKCLAQLLDNPLAGRTPGDIAVKDSSPIMCDNEKAV